MSHIQQRFFINSIKQFLPNFFHNSSVLEVGSLNINGTVRDFFSECQYLGIDVGEGNDVDMVCYGEDYCGPANHFDTVISCEAMEHNPGWQKTWINMIRLLKINGLIIMTCATQGRKQHGTDYSQPHDSPLTTKIGQNYYKNLNESDFIKVSDPDCWFSVWGFFVDGSSHDLYFFGLGLDADTDLQNSARNLKNAFTEHYYRVNTLGMY